jgi:hypothetical protein
MSNDYTALLKSEKDIPVLSTGINSTVTHESTYPTKKHPSLLTHTGKTVNTPLNSTLSARYIKVPTNPKEPHYADRHTLASIRKNALALYFRVATLAGYCVCSTTVPAVPDFFFLRQVTKKL